WRCRCLPRPGTGCRRSSEVPFRSAWLVVALSVEVVELGLQLATELPGGETGLDSEALGYESMGDPRAEWTRVRAGRAARQFVPTIGDVIAEGGYFQADAENEKADRQQQHGRHGLPK